MEMMGKGIGLERGLVGGSGALESSTEELAENNEPKRLAFSVGVIAIEPSARVRGGKLDLQKLLRIFYFIFAVLSLLDDLFVIPFLVSACIILHFLFLFHLSSIFFPSSFLVFFPLFFWECNCFFLFYGLRSHPHKFRLYLKAGEARDPLQWCPTGEIVVKPLSQGGNVSGRGGVRTHFTGAHESSGN